MSSVASSPAEASWRPPGVTITSWFLVLGGALSLLSSLYAAVNPAWLAISAVVDVAPVWVLALTVAGAVVGVVSGATMLDGRAWGRSLYVYVTPVLLLGGVALYGLVALPGTVSGLVLYAGLTWVLTRPHADAYFDGTLEGPPPRLLALARYRRAAGHPSDLARVFGAVFAGFGGVFVYMAIMLLALGVSGPSPALPEGGSLRGVFALAAVLMGVLPAVALVALGVGLWGRRRWMAVAGWVLLVAGGTTAVGALSVVLLLETDVWTAAMASAAGDAGQAYDPGIFAGMGRAMWSAAGAAVVLAALGGWFLARRYAADRRAVEEGGGEVMGW